MSVYNGLTYLGQAVSSILDQSFDDLEFIIVNDGSTEPVSELLECFQDHRIITIDQENIGLTRSLNKAISLCRGEYVARMDADDISLPQRIERQVSVMDSNPCIDLVGCDYEVIDKEGTVCDRKILIHDNIYRLWRLMFHNVYGHGTMLLRKNALIAAGGYDENFIVAQDYELWSRMSNLTNTLVVPDILYQYRSADQSPQSSVRHYDAQLANAITTSNRSLKACKPDFSDHDCEEVRSVFWKFQRQAAALRGIELLPSLLEGFIALYSVGPSDAERLLGQVLDDVAAEIASDIAIRDSDKPEILSQFRKNIAHWLTRISCL